MRKFWIGAVFTLLVTASAVADTITFTFVSGTSSPPSVTASSTAGLMSGPAALLLINDTTQNKMFSFSGTYVNGNTGPATSLMQFGPLIIGSFTAGGTNSVLLKDSMGNVVVSGDVEDGSSLLASAGSTGSFLTAFHVTSVSPAALALFGLGPAFSPEGSVSFNTGDSVLTGGTFTAQLQGGVVTIHTPVVIPEPASLGLLGMGILTVAGGLRLRKRTHGSPQ